MQTGSTPRFLTPPGGTLGWIGLAVLGWSIARACVQSVTIDEADTVLAWVLPEFAPTHWFPGSNNHVLTSALMRLAVGVFGVNHLTIRFPALLGAALFLYFGFRFVRLVVPPGPLQIALYCCLALNPFFGDYFVAARGYGLALALLLGALVIAGESMFTGLSEAGLPPRLGVVSALLGLSFCASFAFLFSHLSILAVLLVWSWRRSASGRLRRIVTVMAPFAVVAAVICGWTLLKWPAGQLWYGAANPAETVNSLLRSTTYELNNFLVNPLFFHLFSPARSYFYPGLALIAAVRWPLLVYGPNPQSSGLLRAAALIGLVLGATVLLHLLAWDAFHLPLPKERTGLPLVLLFLMLVGLITAPAATSRLDRGLRLILVGLLFGLAVYSAGCLRLNYFCEWKWGADVRRAYDVVSYYHHNKRVTEVPASWHYRGALNYYRAASNGREALAEFSDKQPYPTGRQVYVLHAVFDREFIQNQRLRVVFHGTYSELVIAVAPGLE